MAASVHQHISEARLGLIDDVLLASGWQLHADGWLAPEVFRAQLAQQTGAGHLARHHAIAAQAQYDAARVTS